MYNQFFKNIFPVKFFSIVSTRTQLQMVCPVIQAGSHGIVKCLTNSFQSMKDITSPLMPKNSVKFLWQIKHYWSLSSWHLLQPSFSRLPLRFPLPYFYFQRSSSNLQVHSTERTILAGRGKVAVLCNFPLPPVHTAEGKTTDLSKAHISSYLKLLISLSYSIYCTYTVFIHYLLEAR